jgi:hypothetical protein
MSLEKPAASFSDIDLTPPTFAFFLILTIFISLPSSSFPHGTSDKLKFQRHLVLITKNSIAFEKEVDSLREKYKTKENLPIIIEFGLDYEVQSRICEAIPTLIRSGLKNLLFKSFEGTFPDFNFLEVRFDNPGAHSLNQMVVIHANGEYADCHAENRREIQKALVQLCNTNNLTTPFNQLTIKQMVPKVPIHLWDNPTHRDNSDHI